MTKIITSSTEIRQKDCALNLYPIMKILYLEVKNNSKTFSVYGKSKLKYVSPITDLKDRKKVITSDEEKATTF